MLALLIALLPAYFFYSLCKSINFSKFWSLRNVLMGLTSREKALEASGRGLEASGKGIEASGKGIEASEMG